MNPVGSILTDKLDSSRSRVIFRNHFKPICLVQFRLQKDSAFAVGQIISTSSPILSRYKGRWPSSRTLGQDAVDAAASGANVIAGRVLP
jgi:hypothetical protein